VSRWRGLALGALILVGGVGLVGWNSSRFLTAKPVIRAKNLDFLPAPETARVLALGHTNTLAKLRWIDSFAYFQYQLDRKDDRVAGGGNGFQRLYGTLIQLDPKFEPFYEHAALTMSGILTNHGGALAFLLQGTQELPHSTNLWRNLVATLKVFFKLDERQPVQFDSFLAAWSEAEADPDAKRTVWDWKRQFGRGFSGLEQLPYWLTQLEQSAPGTPSGDYVEGTIRSLLTRFGIHELQGLLASWRIAHGGIPTTRAELAQSLPLFDPLSSPVEQGPWPKSLGEVLDPRQIRRRYPQGLPPYGPIAVQNGRLTLKSDPYGLPWRLENGVIVSAGLLRAQTEESLRGANRTLLDLAQRHGSWPKTLEEAKALGLSLPTVPDGGILRLDGRQVVVDWPVDAGAPWKLRQGSQ
jgi:hypothetical protein